MLRKGRFISLICLFLLFLLGIVLTVILNLNSKSKLNTTPSGVCWISNESHFVDYQITGNIIHFRYLMCFENTSKDDHIVSAISAEFSASELNGWIEYNKVFSGFLDNGQHEILISPGSKVEVICVFSGTYLGGAVNEQLSPPQKVSYIQRISESNNNSATKEQ